MVTGLNDHCELSSMFKLLDLQFYKCVLTLDQIVLKNRSLERDPMEYLKTDLVLLSLMPDLNSSKWPAYIRMSTLLPLWVSCVWSIFFVQCFVSFLVLQSSCLDRESWLLYFDCFSGVLYLFCFLPHGTAGGSAVCDCCISRSYSLTFLYQSMEKGFTDSLQLSGKIESFEIKYRALKIFFLRTSAKQRIKVLVEGHNTVPPTVTCLEIDTLRSSVQRSTKRAPEQPAPSGPGWSRFTLLHQAYMSVYLNQYIEDLTWVPIFHWIY